VISRREKRAETCSFDREGARREPSAGGGCAVRVPIGAGRFEARAECNAACCVSLSSALTQETLMDKMGTM
jgi:hypothetical protein